MTLRIHDTATREVREFTPLVPGQVSLYVCGATVQAPPHIGHLRAALAFDVLARWLEARGYQVIFCRNVTDIDDKIIRVAEQEDNPWWVVSERNQRAFTHAYELLGCRPPDVEPRATGHVPEMIALMQRLIDTGHAYAAGGDVYFDVRTDPDYGKLSGQQPDQMRGADDVTDAALKRDPRDFALWKAAKPGEPFWDTPWGPGRPGWHLECSAMSMKYLGEAFDIHGGGIDLVFPHHENEIAQSESAGFPFAQYWMHNALLGVAGEKMSKSLGNSLRIEEILKLARPVELRYYLGGAHYRSVLEFSEDSLAEAAAAYKRIEGFVDRAAEALGDPGDPPSAEGNLPLSFISAMDDDLGVPAALACVHAAVRDGNTALQAGRLDDVRASLTQVRAMLGVLGLDPLSEPWTSSDTQSERMREIVGSLVQAILDQRQSARARKDYATADALREGLEKAGIVVEDTGGASRWEIRR
ncbi:MAG: cysteine--tRNA ligase [Actinobacteria bacterium]|nr:cysteine--tRNA ligase [Actinomycetota bacterium]